MKFVPKVIKDAAPVIKNIAGEATPIKLAIGVPGGFDLSKHLKHDTITQVHCLACADLCEMDRFDIDPKSYPVYLHILIIFNYIL